MASDSETIAEIREDVREYLTSIGPSEYPSETQFEEFADRFESAHTREVAELRKCLKEAVYNECNFCRTVHKDGTYGKCEHLLENGECDHLRSVTCIVHRWRKALEGANYES